MPVKRSADQALVPPIKYSKTSPDRFIIKNFPTWFDKEKFAKDRVTLDSLNQKKKVSDDLKCPYRTTRGSLCTKQKKNKDDKYCPIHKKVVRHQKTTNMINDLIQSNKESKSDLKYQMRKEKKFMDHAIDAILKADEKDQFLRERVKFNNDVPTMADIIDDKNQHAHGVVNQGGKKEEHHTN